RISLLGRLIAHGLTTAEFNVYYGESRDIYDVAGRVAHEAIFNTVNGEFRCPNSQQGYSPFSTWTRGLAWAILGFAEQLEFLATLNPPTGAKNEEISSSGPPEEISAHDDMHCEEQNTQEMLAMAMEKFLRAALVTADYYLKTCCADGVPMWDTGAPNLHRLGDYMSKPSDPFNPWEPVDSSAAAIAAQGFLRLGKYLGRLGETARAARYRQAALTIAKTLFSEPYLSTDPKHQGLLLHSVYHRPNGWDHVKKGQRVPNGESSMWGDYHARELALLILREARRERYLTFFSVG
ncbi:MAG: glycoside hydrolase family 88 protein, partial [Verrucomicrobiae bacterium]|nr:glycoside hydrolase family 88 protein [Verrucomicrobiae bacterium]